jgi:hypothetical protein
MFATYQIEAFFKLFTLVLFMILCDKAFISYLTPKLTHNEPFILSSRTATAPTAYQCILFVISFFLEERRRAPGGERERRYFSLREGRLLWKIYLSI